MLFLLPSQKSSRLGSLVAALQLLVMTRSIDGPPEMRTPWGSRAFSEISNELYQRERFGSNTDSARTPKFDGRPEKSISHPGVLYTHPRSPCALSSPFRSVHARLVVVRAVGL